MWLINIMCDEVCYTAKDMLPDPDSRVAYKSGNLEHYLPGPVFTTLIADYVCTLYTARRDFDFDQNIYHLLN